MFDKLFNQDTPFWNGMGRIFDVFVLNSLWLLCCLPLFTIGPSTTALYYAMINMVRGEEHSVSRDFFHSFRQNFKQGILLGLLLTAVDAFLFVDISMCYHAGTGVYTFFMVFFAVIFLFCVFITLYSFPLLSKFEKKNIEILIWAFTLSIRNLWRTLLTIAALVIGIWIFHLLPGLIFIIPGLIAEFQTALMIPVLKPYLPDLYMEDEWHLSISDEQDAEEDKNEGIDQNHEEN